MSLKRKAYAGSTETMGDRQVRVICSTPSVDRAGEIVVQEGIDTGAYLANPVVLFAHDPAQPIARVAQMAVEEGNLTATVQFPDVGVSAKADEVYGLVKAGVLNTVSIGFQPVEMLAIDPEQPKGPQRYVKSELLELSFVAVPANRGATVVARQHTPGQAGPVVKGLYDIGCLASAMSELGWVREMAAWEADVEADGSKVPAMLGEALQQLGAALVAMAEEEVAEMLADLAVEPLDLPADEAVFVEAASSPAIRKFRAGWLHGRAAVRKTTAVPGVVAKSVMGREARRRAAEVAALG